MIAVNLPGQNVGNVLEPKVTVKFDKKVSIDSLGPITLRGQFLDLQAMPFQVQFRSNVDFRTRPGWELAPSLLKRIDGCKDAIDFSAALGALCGAHNDSIPSIRIIGLSIRPWQWGCELDVRRPYPSSWRQEVGTDLCFCGKWWLLSVMVKVMHEPSWVGVTSSHSGVVLHSFAGASVTPPNLASAWAVYTALAWAHPTLGQESQGLTTNFVLLIPANICHSIDNFLNSMYAFTHPHIKPRNLKNNIILKTHQRFWCSLVTTDKKKLVSGATDKINVNKSWRSRCKLYHLWCHGLQWDYNSIFRWNPNIT